ncbi:ABC transporter permease [Paludibacterium yongneupense]|uniref:ABC transporter permease n=1 Tax=Paludibacterium yongneupense TaxID=400061 RepID=UPI00040249C5|nr:ABC transporter permease [Paludibacterium yongneupense]
MPPFSQRKHDRVLLALTLLMLASLYAWPLLTWAPNRLLTGHALPWSRLANGWHPLLWLPGMLLLPAWALRPRRLVWLATALAAAALLAGLCGLAGAVAAEEAARTPFGRTSFGAAFWSMALLCWLTAAHCLTRLFPRHSSRSIAHLLLWAPLGLLLASGRMDELSVLKEYANRQDVFDDALWRHVQILLATLLPAIATGWPLGLLAFRRPALRQALFAVLNIIQTIPSIALFGLLIAPLAWLAQTSPWLARAGVGGIGMAPAVIALALYALLPIVRSMVAGLEQVPAAVVEAAAGMGLSQRQILLRVELPLALPVVLAGIRITAVQTVGMASVAALIGAGGFGAIMFQGLAGSALDLVLLGVIPVVALAVVLDALFSFFESLLEIRP